MGSGCYTFTIADEFGDGICCTQGNGNYTIVSAFGTHVESDGQYGDGEETEFCLTGVGFEEDPAASLTIFPNPSEGRWYVVFPSVSAGTVPWEVHDLMGRTLAQGVFPGGVRRLLLEVPDLALGTYVMRCLLDGRWRSVTVLKDR